MYSRGHKVLDWAWRYLPSPADPTEPLVLSDEQARFVLEFYRVTGDRYLHRRAALEQCKGWGKSPLGAMLCLAEFVGPFAPRKPYVQIAACSEDQAISNCYVLLWAMLAENDNKAATALGIDLGRGRLYLPHAPGAKLEAVTSSAQARDGQQVTFALLDETQNWNRHNGGDKLARTIRRNATKMGGRVLELANSPELGMDSVAEQTEIEAAGDPSILHVATRPSVLPTPEMTDQQLRDLLSEVYSGCPWVDLDRVLVDVRGADSPWQESVRYFFNVPSAGSGAAVDPIAWSQARRHEATHRARLRRFDQRRRDGAGRLHRRRSPGSAIDLRAPGQRAGGLADRPRRGPAGARGGVRDLRRRLSVRRSTPLSGRS
jgi:hypothetical protein